MMSNGEASSPPSDRLLTVPSVFVDAAVAVITKAFENDEVYWKLKQAAKEEICKAKYLDADVGDAVVDLLRESGLDSRIRNMVYTSAVGLVHPAFAFAPAPHALLPERLGLPIFAAEFERLPYIADAQKKWETRIGKRVVALAQDLALPLARTRTPEAARICTERYAAGDYMKMGEGSAGAGRAIGHLYDHSDFLETLRGLRNPNHAPLALGTDIFGTVGATIGSGQHPSTALASWTSIVVHMSTPGIAELQERYRELSTDLRQVGLDDVDGRDKGWFSAERLACGQKIVNSGDIAQTRQLAKRGLPSPLRPRAWATILGIDLTKSDRALFDQLMADVIKHDLLTDRLWLLDVRLLPGNDDNYFPFEDSIAATALAFSRDAWVGERCRARPNAPVVGKAHQHVVYPPNGVFPFKGLSMTIAPLCFVYADLPIVYQAYRQLHLRYFRWLHTINSSPRGILFLSVLFENLLQTHQPHLLFHLRQLDVDPLKYAFPWLMQGYAGYLDTDQHLILWDRILAYDATELLAIVAVAVFTFRRQALMQSNSAAAVELILLDLRALKVIPLLQCCLFASS